MGNVEISGDLRMIMADLSTIIFAIKEALSESYGMPEEETKECVLHCVDNGFLDREEIRGMGEQALEKMSQEERQDFLTEMVKEIVRESKNDRK